MKQILLFRQITVAVFGVILWCSMQPIWMNVVNSHTNVDCFLSCRTAADYYDVVTTPIDLLKIQQKLKTDEYDDIDLLTNDVRLMINNAKAYYKVCTCFSSCPFRLFVCMKKCERRELPQPLTFLGNGRGVLCFVPYSVLSSAFSLVSML